MNKYKLSENYWRLYELVIAGCDIVAWIEYRHIFDLCLIKLRSNGEVDFGVRGLSYLSIESDKINSADFCEWCKKSKVKFIDI